MEDSWDIGTPAEPAVNAEPAQPVAQEPAAAADPLAPEPAPVVEPVVVEEPTEPDNAAAPDPLDKYKSANGKYLGRYDTPEAVIENMERMQELDRERGRQAAQRAAQPQAPDPAADPLVGEIMRLDTISKATIQEIVEANPDMSEFDAMEMKITARMELPQRQQQYQQQAEAVQQQQSLVSVMGQADEVLFEHDPDLLDFAPLVADTRMKLYRERLQQGGDWNTVEEFNSDVQKAVDEQVVKRAAKIMGQRGGVAAAQARQQPATAAVLPGTAPAPGGRPQPVDTFENW